MEIVLGWLVLSAIVAVLALRRGRSGSGFLILSLLLSPLIGFLVMLVSRDLAREAREAEVREMESMRQAQLMQAVSSQAVASSVADEIAKLKKLADEGVLTAEQFEQQKHRLLQGTTAT